MISIQIPVVSRSLNLALDLAVLRQDFGLHVARSGLRGVELEDGLAAGLEATVALVVEDGGPRRAAQRHDGFGVADAGLEGLLDGGAVLAAGADEDVVHADLRGHERRHVRRPILLTLQDYPRRRVGPPEKQNWVNN